MENLFYFIKMYNRELYCAFATGLSLLILRQIYKNYRKSKTFKEIDYAVIISICLYLLTLYFPYLLIGPLGKVILALILLLAVYSLYMCLKDSLKENPRSLFPTKKGILQSLIFFAVNISTIVVIEAYGIIGMFLPLMFAVGYYLIAKNDVIKWRSTIFYDVAMFWMIFSFYFGICYMCIVSGDIIND